MRLLLPGWVVKPQDLSAVLENEWLSRSWTLPEFILAKDALLIYGNEIMPWQEFLGCIWRGPLKHGSQAAHWQALAQAWLSLPRQDTAADGIKNEYNMRDRLCASRATVFLADRKLGYYVVAPILAGLTAVGVYYQNQHTYQVQGETVLYYITLILPPIAVVFLVSFIIYIILTLLYGANRGSDLPLKAYGNDELFNIISAAMLNRRCSLPQDKCFSLYSVLARYGIDMGRPDYAAEIESIFSTFFAMLLQYNPQALALLVDTSGAVESRATGCITGPSWALNPGTRARPPWIPSEFVLGDKSTRTIAEPPFVDTEAGVLVVPAISLGIITFRTDFSTVWEHHRGAAQDLAKAALTELLLLLEHTQDTYLSRPSKANLKSSHFLFFRSVMMPEVWLKWNHQHHATSKAHGDGFNSKSELRWWERRSNFSALTAEYRQFFIPLLRIIRKHRKYRKKDTSKAASPGEKPVETMTVPARSVERLYRAIKSKKKLVDAFSGWCREVSEHRCRSFFTTATGFPATGGMNVSVGDELFYVPNAPTLMVMRRRLDGHGYTLVGPASGPFKASELHVGVELKQVKVY